MKPRLARLGSASCRNCSMRMWRHCTSVRSVQRSPPLHRSTQFLGVSRLKAPSRGKTTSLVLVCSLPNVFPCRPSCLRSASLFPQGVTSTSLSTWKPVLVRRSLSLLRNKRVVCRLQGRLAYNVAAHTQDTHCETCAADPLLLLTVIQELLKAEALEHTLCSVLVHVPGTQMVAEREQVENIVMGPHAQDARVLPSCMGPPLRGLQRVRWVPLRCTLHGRGCLLPTPRWAPRVLQVLTNLPALGVVLTVFAQEHVDYTG